MEGIELRKAVEEARFLVGARLSRAHQLGDVFFLRFYRPSGALVLDPGGKAFHCTALRPPTPPAPPPFCMLLRSLTGQPLLALEQGGLDRVLRLRFPGGDLILDLRPRQGELFVCSRDGKVTAFRRGELEEARFGENGDPIQGLGPELRRAAAARFGHAPSKEELAQFVGEVLASAPSGYLYDTEGGPLASFFPRPELGEPRATFPSFWLALDLVLERRLSSGIARRQGAEVARAIRRRERALAALAAAESEAARWPELQAQADLILTRLGEIPRGSSEAEVEGFGGGRVRLSLDPGLPPVAYAQRLYRTAKKLRRRLAETPARRRELEAEIERLRGLGELLSREPELAPYLGASDTPAPPSTRRKAPPVRRPREAAVTGFTVLIGRSGEENDRLVRAARPDDVWLHARGVPGAHVLIRTDGRPVPREVLVRAAELAAWHSRGRGERKVAVSYTEARYVRKPKGVPPGMVTLLREEVLVVGGDRGP